MYSVGVINTTVLCFTKCDTWFKIKNKNRINIILFKFFAVYYTITNNHNFHLPIFHHHKKDARVFVTYIRLFILVQFLLFKVNIEFIFSVGVFALEDAIGCLKRLILKKKLNKTKLVPLFIPPSQHTHIYRIFIHSCYVGCYEVLSPLLIRVVLKKMHMISIFWI